MVNASPTGTLNLTYLQLHAVIRENNPVNNATHFNRKAQRLVIVINRIVIVINRIDRELINPARSIARRRVPGTACPGLSSILKLL